MVNLDSAQRALCHMHDWLYFSMPGSAHSIFTTVWLSRFIIASWTQCTGAELFSSSAFLPASSLVCRRALCCHRLTRTAPIIWHATWLETWLRALKPRYLSSSSRVCQNVLQVLVWERWERRRRTPARRGILMRFTAHGSHSQSITWRPLIYYVDPECPKTFVVDLQKNWATRITGTLPPGKWGLREQLFNPDSPCLRRNLASRDLSKLEHQFTKLLSSYTGGLHSPPLFFNSAWSCICHRPVPSCTVLCALAQACISRLPRRQLIRTTVCHCAANFCQELLPGHGGQRRLVPRSTCRGRLTTLRPCSRCDRPRASHAHPLRAA